MSFLAPLFLLGAGAIALPLIFHLIRQTTKVRTPFSSLMFLLPTPPRLTRRSRLENILLLLLRCAVILLLALAFARPFFSQPITDATPANSARRILLMVDTSASMQRSGLWPQAREQARNILREASASDAVAVYTFNRQLAPLMTFEQGQELPAGQRAAVVEQKLADVAPGWHATQTGQALVSAAEILADHDGNHTAFKSEIVLISDMQEGSRLASVQGYEWPKHLSLEVVHLKPARSSNASLQLAAEQSSAEGAKRAERISVRVSNSPGSINEQFTVGWAAAQGDAFLGAPVDVYVPAGQTRTVALPIAEGGVAASRILLKGDDEEFDNNVYVVPPRPVELSVLYLGRDQPADSKDQLYFLNKAFQETKSQLVRITAPGAEAELESGRLAESTVIIAGDLPANRGVELLRESIKGGKTALVVLRDESSGAALGELLAVDALRIEELRPPTYALLAEIDFRHPLFAPFSDPRFSDFTRIRFWQYRKLDASLLPGARVLAKFDSGDPAVVEVPFGQGRVIVLTSGWRPDDSQLALSSKFVPLLYILLEQSGAPTPPPSQLFVGDSATLASFVPPDVGVAEPIEILRPRDNSPQVAGRDDRFSATIEPGVYRVRAGEYESRFVVNLDPAESRIMGLPADELERLGAPVATGLAPSEAQVTAKQALIKNNELENRQKVWRWFIVGAIGLLMIETWVAARTARKLAPVNAEAV